MKRDLDLKDLFLSDLGSRIKQANDEIEKLKNYIKNIQTMKRIMKTVTNGKIYDRLKKEDPAKLREYMQLCETINKRRRAREEENIVKLKKMVDEGKIVGLTKEQIDSKLKKKLKRLGLGEDSYSYLEKKVNKRQEARNNVKRRKAKKENEEGRPIDVGSANDKKAEQLDSKSTDADTRLSSETSK